MGSNHYDGEPFAVFKIDALERALPHCSDMFVCERAAVLLYRYGRPAGRAYLVHELETDGTSSAGLTAAEVFALNRDEEMLPWILKVLPKPGNSDDAFRSLATWHRPEIANALLEAFRKDPEDGDFGTALSVQGVQAAVPLLWKIYRTTKPDEDSGMDKLDAAAALIRLQVPQSPQLMTFLLTQLRLPTAKLPFMVWRMWVIKALGQAGSPQAVAVLQQCIRQYLTSGVSAQQYALMMHSKDLTPDELALDAAESLGAMNAVAALSLIYDFLRRIQRQNKLAHQGQKIYESAETWDSQPALAKILLNLGEPRATVAATMGQAWMLLELAKRSLKPVPDAYLPRDEPASAL